MNEKAFKALENIKREAGTPYFSTLYDIDMWHEDFATVEEALCFPKKVNDELFEFYYAGLQGYAGAKKMHEQYFYMGLLEVITKFYAQINNVSHEEAKTTLANLAEIRIELNKKN